MFESLVNTEGFKTWKNVANNLEMFESLVNTEGFKTLIELKENKPPV